MSDQRPLNEPSSDQKPKPSNRRTILIIAAVGLIFACAACGLITFVLPDSNSTAETSPQSSNDAVEETDEQPVATVAEEGDEPTEAPPTQKPTAEPTSTDAPTDTPAPTATDEPMETPTPTSSPTPAPEPLVLTGTGDSVVDVEKWPGPALAHITGNAGLSHFAVVNLDADGNQIDLLVNTVEAYDGVRPLDFFDDQHTARFEVTAAGDWTIEILPLLEGAIIAPVPGVTTGTGDAVLILEAAADVATITGNDAARHFAVESFGGLFPDLLVNTVDPYTGQVQLSPDARILAITAAGPWTVELTAR